MLCAGNQSEFCGGPNRLNAYNYTGTGLSIADSGGMTAVGGPFPVLSGLPTGWAYNACWVYVIFLFSCFVFLMGSMCCLLVITLMGGSSLSSLKARLPTLLSLVSLDALLITLRSLVPNTLVSRRNKRATGAD